MLFGYLLSAAFSSTALNKQMLAVLDAIPGKTWEATGSSRIAQMSDEDFQSMLMDRKFLKSGLPVSKLPASAYKDVPEAYDYRDKHPNCEGEIFDQGNCGSSWAFAATSTFSDRRCVAGKTEESEPLSQQYQVSCDTKDTGCEGGFLVYAWEFFKKVGVPSLDCVDYTDEAYDDGITTECPKKCDDGSDISLIKIRKRGKNVGGNVERMKAALYNDGPLFTGFTVYQDFKAYKSGIYKHQTGEILGGHAVEIVGYGSENGTDFWTVRNSWGEDWGEDGFFRIARGVDECLCEEHVIAGKV